jgi:hypothetical protein
MFSTTMYHSLWQKPRKVKCLFSTEQIFSTPILVPQPCHIYPWDGKLLIYSESKNRELFTSIILAVCEILMYNLKEQIHDNYANNSGLLLDGSCKLAHLRDSYHFLYWNVPILQAVLCK